MNLKPKRIVITTLALVTLTSAGLIFFPTLDPNEITESKLLRTLQQDQTKLLHEDVHYAVYPNGEVNRIQQQIILSSIDTHTLYNRLMRLNPNLNNGSLDPTRIPNTQFHSFIPDNGVLFYENSKTGFVRYIQVVFASEPKEPAIAKVNYTKKVSPLEFIVAKLKGSKVYTFKPIPSPKGKP